MDKKFVQQLQQIHNELLKIDCSRCDTPVEQQKISEIYNRFCHINNPNMFRQTELTNIKVEKIINNLKNTHID